MADPTDPDDSTTQPTPTPVPTPPAVQPAADPTAPGAGATTKPEPLAQTGGNPPKQPGATQAEIAEHAYELMQRAEASREKSAKYFESITDQLNQLNKDNPQPEQPALKAYPVQPDLTKEQQKGKNAMRAYGLLAIPLVLAFGRKGSGAAMRGIVEGMQNIKAGFADKAKAQYTAWRENVEAVHEKNQQRLQVYKDQMSARTGTVHEKLESIKMIADAYKDVGTARAAEAGDWEKFSEYLGKMEKLQKDTEEKVLNHQKDIANLFGSKEEDSLYRSWGAENYPELAEGLYSTDPKMRGAAERALQKHKSFWNFSKENHIGPFKETAAEKEADETLNPPGTNPKKDAESDSDIDAHIRELHQDLLGPLPKKEGQGKEKKRSTMGFDPRRPFSKDNSPSGLD